MPIFSTPAAGRGWPLNFLPDDERAAIDRHVRELDRLAEDLGLLDRQIAQDAIGDPAVNRLMTISGVNLAGGGLETPLFHIHNGSLSGREFQYSLALQP